MVKDALSLYLTEINDYGDLEAEEEKRLFEIVSKTRKTPLNDSFLQSRNKLVEHNLGLVVFWAKRYAFKDITILDLIQEGSIGLMRAVANFKPTEGNFGSYASTAIKNQMIAYIKRYLHPLKCTEEESYLSYQVKQLQVKYSELDDESREILLREELGITEKDLNDILMLISNETLVPLDATIDEEGNYLYSLLKDPNSDEESDFGWLRTKLEDSIKQFLSPLEQKVVNLTFGLAGESEISLSEAAKMLRLTKSRTREVQSIALRKLRLHLQGEKALALY